MFEYPAEIFGAKMREEKFGPAEEQYILYCYDIFGGTYSVHFDGDLISSRFDYGEIHSSSCRSINDFEGFERNAAKLVKLVLDYFIENQKSDACEVYDKFEADKVIAEKDAEIARLNAIRKVHVEAIESMGAGLLQDEEENRHSKYKRCLAMASWCCDACDKWMMRKAKAIGLGKEGIKEYHQARSKLFLYMRWQMRWLKIAEQFKDKEAE